MQTSCVLLVARKNIRAVVLGIILLDQMLYGQTPPPALPSATPVTTTGKAIAPSAPEADLKKPIMYQGLDNSVQLETVTVIGQLDAARQRIVPSTGATVYSLSQDQIQGQTQGDNVSFNRFLLRFPGVSQDDTGSGNYHIRDEHGNVQYRINDVLIPEGITGFGNEFDTRFADRVDLITGALPSQYGFRTTGILDIHTKSGSFQQGGDLEMYGGSHETIHPSFEYGGSQGKLNYYVSGSYLQNTLGSNNPTTSDSALHDNTDQRRGFLYTSYVIDDSSRISLIAGESFNYFQIPNTPGDPGAAVDGAGNPFPGLPATLGGGNLQNTQDEQNNYEVVAYQKTVDDLDFQLALFNRYSNVSYRSDTTGNLYANGVSGNIDRSLMSQGLQYDASYNVGGGHTLRAGLTLDNQGAQQQTVNNVFTVDGNGAAIGAGPITIPVGGYDTAYVYGFYLQDEWKITKQWTVNYGGRFDLYQNNEISQNQISPRLNSTFEFDKNTTFHAGYASYFTPPNLENAPANTGTAFSGTNNTPTPGLANDSVQSERAHYFDVGVVHNFTKEYQVGLDAYYKLAQNQIDDGQFGAAPILSEFNYRRAEITGAELSQNYNQGGFSAYGNVAVEQARGTGWNSAQSLLFSADEYNYVAQNYIYLDHSQTLTGSAGVSYLINETRPYAELIAGSGLRSTRVDGNGTTLEPNGDSVPAYDTINIGFSQTFGFCGMKNLTARFDITNLFDQNYFLRGSGGVGVFNATYGERRSFFGGITYSF